MKKIAILVCLAMLISMFAAVNVSAVEAVTSTVDFRTLTPAEAGDASNAAMESLGVDVEGNWWVQDCFHVFATPKDGYAACSYIQILDAGEGKVLASDASISLGWWMAVVGDPSWLVIEYGTDGENWVELWADETGHGTEWQPDAYLEGSLPLPGTAGASKVYVRISVERHSGQTSGGVSYSQISAIVKGVEEAVSLADFRALNPTDAGDASKAAIEALGITVPEGSNWHVQNCIQNLITPKDGYAPTAYIQTLDLGDKALAEDAILNLGYYMAALGDPSWMVIDWSVDGENWTDEGWVDETGAGGDWEAAEQHDVAIPLEGTAGASKVYVRVTIERHSGPIGGAILYSIISGNPAAGGSAPTEPSEPAEPSDPTPPTGDAIGLVVALMAVSGAALIVLKKKEN